MKYVTFYKSMAVINHKEYGKLKTSFLQKKDYIQTEQVVVRKLKFQSYCKDKALSEEPVFDLCMKKDKGVRLYLEKESVQNNIFYKSYEQITKDELTKILNGDVEWMKNHEIPLFAEFYLQYTINQLKKQYIEECEKEVVQCKNNSYMVFYKSVKRGTPKTSAFLADELPLFEQLREGQVLMEHKRPVTIPLAIANIVHTTTENPGMLAYSL